MHEILVPDEVKISRLQEIGSLSPNNYKEISIKNKKQKVIADFLDQSEPFDKGIEPGSGAYVKKSEQIFLRNSCINNIKYTNDVGKYIYLNPNYYQESNARTGDILLCTDANIGDACYVLSEPDDKILYSSGMVKLNFKNESDKLYVLAFLRDDYFREQLDAKTPKGATIRHAGNRFLECKIPTCDDEWICKIINSLMLNIIYSENECEKKLRYTESWLRREFMSNSFEYVNPTFSKLSDKGRLDSGIYSDKVFQWRKNIEKYPLGYCDLENFGFELKRGPNLAKRDLGRSIQTETYRKGYSVLIYPSDISSSGYIEKVSYLGARNPIWYLEEKNILFSAEGTVGKTFVVCDETMHFTTNFHGTIVKPIDDSIPLYKSIFLGLYLNFLRSEGVFERMSVGGNGGSFAVGYWDNILIPKLKETDMKKISEVYYNKQVLNPTCFDIEILRKSGIYELNEFLIKCKAMLKQICSDVKVGKLKDKEFYENYAG